MLWAARKGAIITAGKYSKLLGETKALLSFEITLFCTNFLFWQGWFTWMTSKLYVYNILSSKYFKPQYLCVEVNNLIEMPMSLA